MLDGLFEHPAGYLDAVADRVLLCVSGAIKWFFNNLLIMPLPATDIEQARVAENLRRTVELTELGLALRQAVIRQRDPQGGGMTQVMHEIRLAKEQAWRQSRS